MTISPKTVSAVQTRLHDWYRRHHRKLPWRDTRDPYRIWVSEVMLQQTQVKTVLPYYQRFLERYPDLWALAQAEQEAVLKAWEGLGYYARARNLHRAAQVLRDGHNGVIPNQWSAFRKLPGAGDYITAAVLSIAFGRPHAVVDGNVKRVLARLLTLDTPVNQGSPGPFKAAADALLDPRCPGLHNQAVMELGALVCKPKAPRCEHCPLPSHCLAFQKEIVGHFPKRRPSRKVPTHHVAVGVVIRKEGLLITRRPSKGLLGGLWEFPGGRIEPHESPEQACIREIAEETGLAVTIHQRLTSVKHAYTHFKVVLEVFLCRDRGGKVCLKGPVDYRWITVDQIDQFPFPKANHKFIPELKKILS